MSQWQWGSFKEARDAFSIMPLRELQAFSGIKHPWLFPLSGWAAALGPIVYLAGGRFPILQLIGPAIFGYGILALMLNKARAADYRNDVYRKYVMKKADEAEEPED
jgi:hypothetical protein